MKILFFYQVRVDDKNDYQKMKARKGTEKIIRQNLMYDNFKQCNEENQCYVLEFEKDENADTEAGNTEDVEVKHWRNAINVEENQKTDMVDKCEYFRKTCYDKSALIFCKVFPDYIQ